MLMSARAAAVAVALVAAVVPVASRLRAQAPASNTPPAFEVASIKLNRSGSFNRMFGMPADRFVANNIPLQGLIALAYGEAGSPLRQLAAYQIVGGPSWIRADSFDVDAKSGRDVPTGQDGLSQKLLMMRTLLSERFKLVVHHETRDVPIYALVLARSDGKLGRQLRRSAVDCETLMAAEMARTATNSPAEPPVPVEQCAMQAQLGGGLMFRGQKMATIVSALSHLADRLVTDRTGLAGQFDLDLQFSPDGLPGLVPPPGLDRSAANSDSSSIFVALQEQLGLKLESTTGPVDVLVIDHVERPTGN